jgi:hypothetical protein
MSNESNFLVIRAHISELTDEALKLLDDMDKTSNNLEHTQDFIQIKNILLRHEIACESSQVPDPINKFTQSLVGIINHGAVSDRHPSKISYDEKGLAKALCKFEGIPIRPFTPFEFCLNFSEYSKIIIEDTPNLPKSRLSVTFVPRDSNRNNFVRRYKDRNIALWRIKCILNI